MGKRKNRVTSPHSASKGAIGVKDHRGVGAEQALVPAGAAALASLFERTRKTIADAVPPNTKRAYEGDLRRFASFCTNAGLIAMPASAVTIAVYLRALADNGKKVSTIERALAAISVAHSRAGHVSPWKHPVVADALAGLRRELGVRPTKKKAADEAILRRLVEVLSTDLLGIRDRAMLLIGWCGALRRSELVALDVRDIAPAAKGLVVAVRRSKTDQKGEGADIPIFFSNDVDLCPVRALSAWLGASEITEGAIYRRLGPRLVLGARLAPAAVRDRVKRWAKDAGLPFRDYAAHSLRSGFMTTAARSGKDLDSIMTTSRHKSERVARGYLQRATVHERGAGEGLL